MLKLYGYTTSFKKLVDFSILCMFAALASYFIFSGRGDATASYVWDWKKLCQFFVRTDDLGQLHAGLLTQGLFNTLRIGLWATLLAALLGLCFGFMRSSKSLFLRLIAGTYVGTVRNIPPLVLVFVTHFFVATLFEPYIAWGAVRSFLSEVPLAHIFIPLDTNLNFFCSAVIALGLYEGAYTSEIVRAGLESVPKLQWEAGYSLGLPRSKVLFYVVLPQSLRLMLPPLVSQSVTLVKDSSIVSAISVTELTYQGRELMNTTFMVFEIWISITLVYLAISLIISGFGHILEGRSKWRSI